MCRFIDKAAVFHHNLWALALGKLSPIFFFFFASGLENLLERPKPGKPSMKILDPCLCLAYVFFFFFSFMLSDTCWRTFLGGKGAVQIMRDGAALDLQAKLASTDLLCCVPAWLLGFVQQTCMLAILHAYIAALLPSKIDPLLFLTNNTKPRVLEPCLCFLCFSVCLLRLGSRLLDLSLGFRRV